MKVFEVTRKITTKNRTPSDIDSLFRDQHNDEEQISNKVSHNTLSRDETRNKLSSTDSLSHEMSDRAANHLRDLDNSDIDTSDDENISPDDGTDIEPQSTPTNLPAVISKDLQATGTRNVDFMQVKDLPGMMKQGIKRMGSQVFSMFTNTPIDDIAIIANINGMGGPNELQDINAVAGYAKRYGQEETQAQMNFDRSMPGYNADVKVYTVNNMTYMLVKDFMGSYIYSWPKTQSKRLREGYIPNPTKAMLALFRISTSIRRNLMKVNEILEMSDDDIRGDTGEKPVRALSPEMVKRKKRDLEAARVNRDMSTRSKGSRLRGRGKGTAQADQSMIQK